MQRGLKETEKIIKELLNLKSSCGKEKRSTLEKLFVPEKQYIDAVLTFAETQLKDIYSNAEHTKLSRDAAVNELKKEVLIKLKESYASSSIAPEPGILEEAFTMACKHVFRQLTFETGRRTDGRNLKQLRPISCKVDLFAPLHGSAVFQRCIFLFQFNLFFKSRFYKLIHDFSEDIRKFYALSLWIRSNRLFVTMQFPFLWEPIKKNYSC